MPRVPIGDIHLYVEDVGAGEPLVLLHGFTGSAELWAPHVGVFARRYRILAVDLLGHGRSSICSDPQQYQMERCVADLATLLDRLGITRAHWLGYSLGGRVALGFAVAHPERVYCLILEGASAGIADPAEKRARIAHDEALAARLERDGIGPFVDAWMQQPLFASQARRGSAALAAARATRCKNNPMGLANSLRGIGTGVQPPLWDHLSDVRVPTLLLVGEEDIKFRTIAATMATRLPHAEVAVIPEAGHTTHLENPLAFQTRVLTFLESNHMARLAAVN
jgi:2-succinyl-6-hydroxy-2,4-cyclohexadiene-1-carboxylate synthase